MITLRSLPKAIAHIDCDAFFASVEQALHPELRGRPVITGQERGIAASLSYEAKRKGVTRGMRLFEIKKVCPECVILPSDYETYSLFSERMFGIIRRFTPDIEEYSIDEAFADLTGLRRIHRNSYEHIALQIKRTVEKELAITVSVGLSLSKSLAKICSKYRKPSGFTCVKGYELHLFLKKIPTEAVCGFGPSSVALLAKYRVYTVWDYIQQPENFAKKLLGKIGVELWHELRGEAVYEITQEAKKPQRSLSKVKTFTPPSDHKEFVRAQVLRNLESAFIKLRRHSLQTQTVGVLLTDSEFKAQSLGADLTRPTSTIQEAAPIASELFEHIFDPCRKYRQTGIFLTELCLAKNEERDLFDDMAKIRTLREISACIDEVNARYGKHTLHLGATSYLNTYTQHLGRRGDVAPRKIRLLKGETFRQRIHVPLWGVKV